MSNLLNLRQSLNLTQEELVEKSGVSRFGNMAADAGCLLYLNCYNIIQVTLSIKTLNEAESKASK